MSYILDALKKSEFERRSGSAPVPVPGASYVLAPERRSRYRGAAFLVGAGMLVTGIALGNWRPWQELTPTGKSPAMVPSQPQAAVVSLAPVVLPALPEAPGPAQTGEARPPSAQPSAPTATPPKPPAAAKAPAGLPAVARAQAPAPAKVVAKTPAKVAVKGASAIPPAAAERAVVAYRDLPANIQTSLPKISFGGYAGVDESEVRIAFINNRLVKEGEEVSPGLKLERVGQEGGVVLSYQGHRFRPTP